MPLISRVQISQATSHKGIFLANETDLGTKPNFINGLPVAGNKSTIIHLQERKAVSSPPDGPTANGAGLSGDLHFCTISFKDKMTNSDRHWFGNHIWATRLQIIWIFFPGIYLSFNKFCNYECCKEKWVLSLFLTFGVALILAIFVHISISCVANSSNTIMLLPMSVCLFFAYQSLVEFNDNIGGIFYLCFTGMIALMLWMSNHRSVQYRMYRFISLMLIVVVVFSVSQLFVEFSLKLLYDEMYCLVSQDSKYFQVRPQVPGILAAMIGFSVLNKQINNETIECPSEQRPSKYKKLCILLFIVGLYAIATYAGYHIVLKLESKFLGIMSIVLHISVKAILIGISIVVLRRFRAIPRAILIMLLVLISASIVGILHNSMFVELAPSFDRWFLMESAIMLTLSVSAIITCTLYSKLVLISAGRRLLGDPV